MAYVICLASAWQSSSALPPRAPQFTAPTPAPLPARTATITDFGAVSDGNTINTVAIQKAIDSLAQQGGGTLFIPADTKTGRRDGRRRDNRNRCRDLPHRRPFLKPGVNLHLEKGAILKGSTDIKDYPSPAPASKATSRTGARPHQRRSKPTTSASMAQAPSTAPARPSMPPSAPSAAGPAPKTSTSPAPASSSSPTPTTVSICGIHLLNSGFWNLHLYNCQNVTIDGLDIRAPPAPRSTDGIDIDSCQWVTIKNTFISNNDDCIALKGTKGVDAPDDKDSPPVEHIHVSNCTFNMGGSLVTCGSEATIVRDVLVEHCTFTGPESRGITSSASSSAPTPPSSMKTSTYNDITLDGVGTLISVAPWTNTNHPPGHAPPSHTVRNISLTNIHGTFGTFGAIRPNPGDTIEKINLENIDLRFTVNATPNLSAVKELTVKNIIVNGKEYQPPAMTEPMQTGTSPQTRP